eukprot:m.288281 g.288281  ORF g.288281 m.288281 type:complete len:119 (-) comp16370_c0_seq45:141-497(-)
MPYVFIVTARGYFFPSAVDVIREMELKRKKYGKSSLVEAGHLKKTHSLIQPVMTAEFHDAYKEDANVVVQEDDDSDIESLSSPDVQRVRVFSPARHETLILPTMYDQRSPGKTSVSFV